MQASRLFFLSASLLWGTFASAPVLAGPVPYGLPAPVRPQKPHPLDNPNVETAAPSKPARPLRFFLIAEDGERVMQMEAEFLPEGVRGRMVAEDQRLNAQLQQQAAASPRNSDGEMLYAEEAPAPPVQRRSTLRPVDGYWDERPVYCRHGRLLGYEKVWMEFCPKCGKYHPQN
ncbi:hypothetical protein [Stratiformator vulcanicus]|nr:hypothetical protein [Stratiformator vulcanicus]